MSASYEALNVLLFLIPGFLSGQVLTLLSRNRPPPITHQVVEALIFAFAIYFLVDLFYRWEPLAYAVTSNGYIGYQLSGDSLSILLTILFALALPIAWAAVIYHDLHMRLLRWLKVTNRISGETAWDDVFKGRVRYVAIHLNDGRRVVGWPLYHSLHGEDGFIYLSQAGWVVNDKYEELDSHGILIERKKINLIEFMWNPDEPGEKQ